LAFPAFAATVGTTSKKCKVGVIALVKIKKGYEEDFKKNALLILKPTRRESGNISYNFHQSTTDSTIFDTYEQWQSEKDLKLHLQTEHMETFFSKVGSYFEPGYPIIHTLKDIECPKKTSDFIRYTHIKQLSEERVQCPQETPCWSEDYPICQPATGGSCSP